MKRCLIVNNLNSSKEELKYIGTKEVIDEKGNLIHFHLVKELGKGNFKPFAIKVGSKFQTLYILN